jgi:hypothetical protein
MSADLDGLELRLGDAGLGTPRISAIAGPSPITKLAPLGSRPPGGSGRSASSNRLSRPAEHHLGDDALLLIGATRGPAQPRKFSDAAFRGAPASRRESSEVEDCGVGAARAARALGLPEESTPIWRTPPRLRLS